jgi:SAM-dependent methyltransferase
MNQLGPSPQAADRGEPSYVWRAGQQRRLEMLLEGAGNQLKGKTLEIGAGIGIYLEKVIPHSGPAFGLEYEFSRALEAGERVEDVINAAAENLPYPDAAFDWLFSNEVIEHVENDRKAILEMIRVLKPGGRLLFFCPNRWYPFETHGIYWKGKYHFGNIPLVNYLPRPWRNRLAPHVRAYTRRDLEKLIGGQPVESITKTVVFGGYDNIISRFPRFGKFLRSFLQSLEQTPFRFLGLSHFWVLEKTGDHQ